MLELGSLAFATPWLLAAFLLLPLLWWLLRVTPPAPKYLRFPAIRLLFGLENPERTPQSSPLWLILLRLAAVAALILALAHPLINPGAQLPGQGPVLIVVDDGWAAASRWDARTEAVRQTIAQADREGRNVIMLTTAPLESGRPPVLTGVLQPADARAIVDALKPKPWPVDREAASKALAELPSGNDRFILWFSDGVRSEGGEAFAQRLADLGNARALLDTEENAPLILLPPEVADNRLTMALRRLGAAGPRDVNVRVLAEDERTLSRSAVAFDAGSGETTASFDLPTELRNEVVRIDIEEESSAAAVALLDERWRRRPVGIASDQPLDTGPALLSETYFIERALNPFSDLRRGSISDLIEARRAVIALPDTYVMKPGELEAVTAWIESGGLLLRFAGPRLAREETDTLTPVPLRRGGRTLGGAMLWSEPARLAAFPSESPFYGLTVPEEVTISRQVLADPRPDLGERTWARLSDGTPLVTTERRGKGRLVLVHTTANTGWTNLPLSGLFVDMLRNIVAESQGVASDERTDQMLPPLSLLDGFGRPAASTGVATAVNVRDLANVPVGPEHPPGYYGVGDQRRALNLSTQLRDVQPIQSLPLGIERRAYTQSTEIDLRPWLLLLALSLFIADVVASLALRGLLGDAFTLRHWRQLRRGAAHGAAALALLAMLLVPADVRAQSISARDQFALDASLNTHLAYVITGDMRVDELSQAGLMGLSNILNQRTAVEAGPPIGVDVRRDELAFFPFLYWPITPDQQLLDEDTVAKLNHYIDNGGTIVFDTREREMGSPRSGGNIQMLRRLAKGLNLPTLEPVPPDHILTKAFYLMQEFPGRWTGDRVWVERMDAHHNDGVSRIITGSHDWAAAWAVDNAGRPVVPVVPGGEKQREWAYRFGVNLVMYTLTGNYKSDQVHVPAILERLGQ